MRDPEASKWVIKSNHEQAMPETGLKNLLHMHRQYVRKMDDSIRYYYSLSWSLALDIVKTFRTEPKSNLDWTPVSRPISEQVLRLVSLVGLVSLVYHADLILT